MKISIHPYGRMVTVDHVSHAVDLDLEAVFPGIEAIQYDYESGHGQVFYIQPSPTPFYGMDGLKGLSDVLTAWNKEDATLAQLQAEALAKSPKAEQKKVAQQPGSPFAVDQARKVDEEARGIGRAKGIVVEDE